MTIAAAKDNSQTILAGTFDYLVKFGLENLHIRALCKHLGYTQSTIYYWFINKENLINKAAIYGLQTVTDGVFNNLFKETEDIEQFLKHSLSKIKKYKNELRSIYQMASSPVYGIEIRKSNSFASICDSYAESFSENTGSNAESLKAVIYIFMSAMLDYAVWEDEKKTKVQLEFIYPYLCNYFSSK